jgi:sterol desaturase/sphingolipid hydroxylase (fatty acid hydroxylase superfamily)
MNAYTILLLALPVVLTASVIEALVLSRRGGYDWREFWLSLGDLAVRQVLRFGVPLGAGAPIFVWIAEHRLFTIPLDGWQAFLLLFLGQEFCYYWYHRSAHRVRWFWASHAVHHSPNQLTLAAAYRLSWTSSGSGTLLFFAPLVWLGFPPGVVTATLAINLLYQFWIHATWVPRLGPLEWVLNTPSAHRVHHAANLDYLDANYGGVLIIFDRLFGTYRAERDDLPCRYGLVKPLRTRNLLWMEFHEWWGMLRDAWRARGLRAKLGALFAPPGWSSGQTTEAMRRAAASPAAAPRPAAAPAE